MPTHTERTDGGEDLTQRADAGDVTSQEEVAQPAREQRHEPHHQER